MTYHIEHTSIHSARPNYTDQKNNFMQNCINQVLSFMKAILDSKMAASFEKSGMKEAISRIQLLFNAASSDEPLTQSEVEAVETTRQTMIKTKGPFQSGMSIYPLGVHVCDILSKKVAQTKQDIILLRDLDDAGDFAKAMKEITAESILKERDGDYDIVVQNQTKFSDMIAKAALFQEKASQKLKSSKHDIVDIIQSRVDQLHDALLAAVRLKYEKKFTGIGLTFESLAAGDLKDEISITAAVTELAECASYQVHKVPIVKLLGKTMAEAFEAKTSIIPSICGLTKMALPKLSSLATNSMSDEGILFEASVMDVFSKLNDAEMMGNVKTLLPDLSPALEKLLNMIKEYVISFLVHTTSTFHGFVLKVMEPEVELDSVLQASIVGTIEADVTNNSNSTCQILNCLLLVCEFPQTYFFGARKGARKMGGNTP